MRRTVELLGLAIAAQALAVWWNGAYEGVSLLTDPAEPLGAALAITVTALIAGVLAWRSFWPTPALPTIGLAFLVIGAFMTFAWPLAFALAANWSDAVSGWGHGAALPQWQGAMTATVGLGLLVRWLLRTRSGT